MFDFLFRSAVFHGVPRIKPLVLWLSVAVVILFFLASSVSIDFFVPSQRARQTAVRMQIVAFMAALDAYKSDVGRFPTESEGLAALRMNPGVLGWNGPYLVRNVPTDPWGTAYRYSFWEGTPLVVSLGGGTASGERGISSTNQPLRRSNGREAHVSGGTSERPSLMKRCQIAMGCQPSRVLIDPKIGCQAALLHPEAVTTRLVHMQFNQVLLLPEGAKHRDDTVD